jgi:hypothetical protein
MGDRGGKKTKEKNQQQQVKKRTDARLLWRFRR